MITDTQGVNRHSNPVGPAYTSNNPARTSLSIFTFTGSERFEGDFHWTSTDFPIINVWYQNFSNGTQSFRAKSQFAFVRAFRRELV